MPNIRVFYRLTSRGDRAYELDRGIGVHLPITVDEIYAQIRSLLMDLHPDDFARVEAGLEARVVDLEELDPPHSAAGGSRRA